MLRDQSSQGDAERTVTLSRRDLSAARRLFNLLFTDDRAARGFEAPPTVPIETAAERGTLVARARDEFDNRRRRVGVFGQSMFGEAAWDMLLALYILDESGQRQTVGGLMQFAGSPTSTAKRWLDYLAAHDLVRREPHPTDRRTDFVSLTDKAREKLDLYLSGTRERCV